jgi:hypothetical protein
MTVKSIIWATVAAGLLGSCSSSSEDPKPGPAAGLPIAVTISEAGAPNYFLNEALVVSSNYQTGSSSMTITGKLNSGKSLTLNFSRDGNPQPYTTDGLEATLDGVSGTGARGISTFNSQTRKVSGNFDVTFPTTGVVQGSFTDVQLY